jgi:Neurotransmitter-gated ion-channel ligand binding domain
VFTLLTGSVQGPHEKRLLHHLLDKYNTLERPVANESEPIQVSFGITLMQIIDVVSPALPCFNEILFNILVKCNARYQRSQFQEWQRFGSTFRTSSKAASRIFKFAAQTRTAEPMSSVARLRDAHFELV